MGTDIFARSGVDEATSAAFVDHLEQLARQLSSHETAILTAVLHDAMGPWERLASRPVDEILLPDELELVERLVEQAHRVP
jgi:hypothetical protein